jgi:hypothetical protein
MGDQREGAVDGKLAQLAQECLAAAAGQARRDLVEEDDARLLQKGRLSEGEELLNLDRQRHHRIAGQNLQLQLVVDLRDLASHGAQVQEPAPAGPAIPQEQVVLNGQERQLRRFLGDQGNAMPLRGSGSPVVAIVGDDAFAAEDELSPARLQRTCDHAHQNGLARPVLADDTVDGAFLDVERGIADRGYASEVLPELTHRVGDTHVMNSRPVRVGQGGVPASRPRVSRSPSGAGCPPARFRGRRKPWS